MNVALTGTPNGLAAVSARGRHLELFRVHNGALEHRWWLVEEPHWTEWVGLEDSPNDLVAVAAASCSDDSLVVFALSISGELSVRWWSLQDWWGDWTSLGGPVYTPLTATSLAYGHLEVYATNGDGSLGSRYLISGDGDWRWSEWQTLG